MNQLIQNLVFENPMLIEIHRFRRRFLTLGGSQNTGAVVLALAALCYFGLLVTVLNYLGDIPSIAIEYIQLSLFTLLAPSLLYGAISGERENRTWDLLLAAPITKAQIVVGKFVGAMAAMLAAAALFGVPILLTALSYHDRGGEASFLQAVEGELMVLCWTAMLSAFTIFISARVKRPFMALGVVLGALAATLIVFPLLVSLLMMGASGDVPILFFLHPFFALAAIGANVDVANEGMGVLFGWPQFAVYLIFTVIFLVWAERTLTFAENDVRFIPKAHSDA